MNKITRDDVGAFERSAYHFDGGTLDLYQEIATKSAIYPGRGTPLGLVYVALKGAGEAGEFAEHVGKAMRDDNFIKTGLIEDERGNYLAGVVSLSLDALTPERRTLLIKEIGDELWYLAAKCNELGITLSEAALTNLEKLCDRTERNALRGSGDER